MRRARTLAVALALAALSALVAIAFYSISPDAAPYLSRVGDYIVHQNALAHAGAFALPNVPSYTDPDQQLALIELDERSAAGDAAARLAPFPYPRGTYGVLLEKLAKAGAKVAVFDIAFLDPSADPAQDARFAAGMRSIPTVLPMAIDTTSNGQIGEERPPQPLASAAAELGFATLDTPGGFTIGQPQEIRTGASGTDSNERLVSLAAAALEQFTGKPVGAIPLDRGRMLYLPFAAQATQAQTGRVGAEQTSLPIAEHIAFADAYAEPLADLRALVNGKIVLIGSTAQALGDFAVTAGGRIPGVYANARFIDQLLTRTFIRSVPPWLDIAAIVVLALLCGVALTLLRPGWGIAACLIGTALYIEGNVALYAYRLYWLDLIHVAGAMLLATLLVGLYRVLTEGAQRRMVTEMFGMHVSPAIVRHILAFGDARDALHLRGTRVKATIFYSDIRGFTAMSETMTPEAIYEQLNEYFDAMCAIIFKYGGYVDKFIGDCIMAVFSAPYQTPDDAHKAVMAAVEQQHAIAHLAQRWIAAGQPPFTVGMGINTGDVVMGNLGASSRMNYTVIGDSVNVAARLYNVAKGGEIIISETTYAEVRSIVNVTELEPVSVKGKTEPLRIYNVTGLCSPTQP